MRTDEFGRERCSPSYGYRRRVSRSSSISSIEEQADPATDNSTTINGSENLPNEVTLNNIDGSDNANSVELDFSNFAELFGFDSFRSSKGQEHTESDASLANKRTKRKYRQYMNRVGGFNRPLSPK